jgi:hypothetical protein
MIELTAQQHEAIAQNGTDPVCAVDRVTGAEYVLVRSEVYERLMLLLSDDMPDTSALINEVMADDDAHDPYLEHYQQLVHSGEDHS